MPVIAFSLELIADDFFDKRNHQHEKFGWWLRYMGKLGTDKSPSKIIDYKTGKPIRFIRDFGKANHNGSRGIYARYFLSDGVYRVCDRYKLNQVRHFIILVENGSYREIGEQEAESWLKEH